MFCASDHSTLGRRPQAPRLGAAVCRQATAYRRARAQQRRAAVLRATQCADHDDSLGQLQPFLQSARSLSLQAVFEAGRHKSPPDEDAPTHSSGFFKRLHRTLLHKHFRIKDRRKFYESVAEIQTDVDTYLLYYYANRPHQVIGMNGRTPYQAFRECLHEPPSPVAVKLTKKGGGTKEANRLDLFSRPRTDCQVNTMTIQNKDHIRRVHVHSGLTCLTTRQGKLIRVLQGVSS